MAFAVDWVVMAAWAGALFAIVMLASAGHPTAPSGPWTAQGIGFLSMSVPVTLYFAVLESSAVQATLGKRVLGLKVWSEHRERLPFTCAVLRNGLKFLPWEAGHTVAQQALYSAEAGFPAWAFPLVVVSFVGPVWWVWGMIATGRSPYDRWAEAQVALVRP